MVADQMEERFTGEEVASLPDGVRVPKRRGLRDKPHAAVVSADRLGVADLIARPDDDADLFHPGSQDLVDQDAEDGLLLAVPIDQSLQRQSSLIAGGGGDDCFADLHEFSNRGV